MKKLALALLLIASALTTYAGGYKTVRDISYLHAPDTLKIIAIGNSFSEDAVENNLWELLDAAGIPAIVGNLYIGGCTLERHYNNSVADAPAYRYRKVVGGKTIEKRDVKSDTAEEVHS